eukprot:TRINITY_DN6791_c0_g2_i1.p1 TRINITY_DN6791_c0_g2~~TRINITY_DN6791_c0_g2_i1.p1  ORF type:complete len:290 (+),score=11.07 TRINITY_DN6791_c0_g2_i1:37-906(+)
MAPCVLLGFTGRPSTEDVKHLVHDLRAKAQVKVIVTNESKTFVHDIEGVIDDAEEWYEWQKVGDPVLHINLNKWSDCLVVASLSASYLGKLAHGLCDDLLTSVIRAWPTDKPIVLAPSMHEREWLHQHTSSHLRLLADVTNLQILLGKRLLSAEDAAAEVDAALASGSRELTLASFQNVQEHVLATLHSQRNRKGHTRTLCATHAIVRFMIHLSFRGECPNCRLQYAFMAQHSHLCAKQTATTQLTLLAVGMRSVYSKQAVCTLHTVILIRMRCLAAFSFGTLDPMHVP